MTSSDIKKYTKIILWAVPILPLISFGGFYYPFIIGRTFYLYSLVILGFLLYFGLLLLDWKKYKPKFDWATGILGIYTAVFLLAGFFGKDTYHSFWSIFERMDGLITLLYVFGFFLLLKIFFQKEKDWIIFGKIAVFTSFLVSLYGIIQKFNLLPVFKAGIDRAASTIGNAAFLAGYLILATGIALYLWAREENKKWKYIFLAISAINLWVVFLTATRGAVLGLFIGIIFIAFGALVFYPDKRKKLIAGSFLLFLILIGIDFGVSRERLAVSNIDFIRRVSTISLSDSNISNRLNVWKLAVESFKENPVLGVGPENFYIEFNRLYTPEISEDWFDRTHNIYLDQLMHAGIIGLLAYLAVWICLFLFLWKKRDCHGFGFWIMSGFLIAYAIHNFFVFDTINTFSLFVFVFGWMSFNLKSEDYVQEETKNIFNPKIFLAFSVILVGALILFFYTVIKPYSINRNLYKGYMHIIADPQKSYEYFAKNLDYSRFGVGETAAQAFVVSDVLISDKDETIETKQRFLGLVRSLLAKSVGSNKYDVRNRLYLGEYLINYGTERVDLLESEAALRQAVVLSPTRPESTYLLFNVLLKQGETEKALSFMKLLTDRLPDFGEPYFHIANILRKSDLEEAEEYFEKGISLEFRRNRGTIRAIVEYMVETEQYERVLPYFETFVRQNPESPSYRVDLARIYYLNGMIDEAIEIVNSVYASNPEIFNDEEIQVFVNLLMTEYEKEEDGG